MEISIQNRDRANFTHCLHCVKSVQKRSFFSGPCFPSFLLNMGNYRPEKTPYLDTFHTAESSV